MFWLLFLAMFLRHLAKAWPNGVTEFLCVQANHVECYGLSVHDLVFPTFLFLAGCSWPFSLASQRAKGATTRQILWKILKRFALLFFLGWTLFGLFTFDPSQMRVNSILGRIGFGWAVMAVVTLFFPRRWWLVALGLFVAFWGGTALFAAFAGAPDAGVATMIGRWDGDAAMNMVDKALLSFLPKGWQREYFYALPGCVLSAFIGYGAGLVVRDDHVPSPVRAGRLASLALGLGAVGAALWIVACPCCKYQWNPTFIFISGGLDAAALSLLHLIVDVCGFERWTLFFKVIGANALAMYMFGHFVSFAPAAHCLFGGVERLLSPVWTPLVNHVACFAFQWLFFLWLYRRKTFIRV